MVREVRREEAGERDIVISVAIREEVLAQSFERTSERALFECEHCVTIRPDLPIRVSYGPKRPVRAMLESWHHFGILPVPALIDDSDGWAEIVEQ